MKKLAYAIAAALSAGAATAKLPPLSDEAKAKADKAKARTAWGDKLAVYKLCQAQDKVVANYRKVKAKDAKPATAGFTLSPCQDPGPFFLPAPAVVTAASAASSAAPAASPPVKK
jgi:hypothetical protein